MFNYFGVEFLQRLLSYYSRRLRKAIDSNFDAEDSKYHWLYKELVYRANRLHQTLLIIQALPCFIIDSSPETAFSYVKAYTSQLFTIAGVTHQEKASYGKFFSDSNQYWIDVQAVFTSFDLQYSYTGKPLFYVDLSEYLIRCIRLHFFIRESTGNAIDRRGFDELMRWSPETCRSA